MKKYKNVLFALMFLMIACLEKPEAQDAIISVTDSDIQAQFDFIEVEEIKSFEDATGEDVLQTNEDKKDAVYLIPCGEYGFCPADFICLNEKICCPPNMTQECNGQCFPEDCQCVVDGEIVLCLPENMKYCGKGISCLKEDVCHLDGETYYCVPQDKFYCGNGLMCQKDKEDCYFADDLNGFYCKEKGLIYCGQEKWCENWQVCPSCCPKEQSISCGEICCYSDGDYTEQCVNSEESICLPKEWIYCNGQPCGPGNKCPDDDLAICVPKNGDYCGNGVWCDPGQVCATDGECCPQGKPQRCGKICCPDYYDCLDTLSGKKCVYPGKKPCGDVECDTDEYCADENKNLCLHYLSTLCPDGHICEDGTYCAGPTCCSYFKPNQNCGNLCCPSNWQCINFGEACIPPNATYIGNGKYCDPGTFYNKENGHCDPVGWEPCGSGPACPPNMKCAKEGTNKQCCPADQATLCGDKCCYTGFQCIHHGSKNVCIPPGAEYCWGTNVNEWCPPATFCGKKGKKCIPIGAMECENGDFCPIGMKCTESNPPCCPWSAPVPCETHCCSAGYECKKAVNGANLCCQKGAPVCGNFCCAINQKCVELNGEKKCIPEDAEVCPANLSLGIFKDTICYNQTFCAPDGYCVSDKKKLDNYCGGGNGCDVFEPAMYCGGLCTNFCCSQFNIGCAENCGSDFCCFPLNVGCINSCMPAWSVCAAVPQSNSPTAYLNPKEGFYGPFSDGKGNIGPGLSKNITADGIYHAEWDVGNWLTGNPGDTMLVVEAVWIIDNLEVAHCKMFDPHGPFGKLYLRVHSLATFPKTYEIHIDWVTNKLHEYNLRGPHAGPCPCQTCIDYWFDKACWCISDPVTDEWLDNQFLRYSTGKAGIYKWGENEEAIYLSIIEGDYSNSDDIGGVELISKKETFTPCGKWVPFYKYETISCQDSLCLTVGPKWPKKTNKIAAFLLLRTIVCTGKPGDPC